MRARLGQPCISMISSRTISIFCCCAQVRYSFTDLILQSRSIYYCTSISIFRFGLYGLGPLRNHVFPVGENLMGKFRIGTGKLFLPGHIGKYRQPTLIANQQLLVGLMSKAHSIHTLQRYSVTYCCRNCTIRNIQELNQDRVVILFQFV